MPVHTILVGSYSDEITTLQFDTDAEAPLNLKVVSSVKSGQSPSWIALHPTDRSLLFTTNEVTDGKVQLFKVADDGSLTYLAERSSGGEDPASLAVLEKQVIVANYSGGTVLPIPISTTAPYFLEPKQSPIAFEGSGPNKDRQTSAHPHQVVVHPTRDGVIIPDLGTDTIWTLKEKDGEWAVADGLKVEAGKGPRHVVIHNDVIYTALELANEVSSHTFPAPPEKPSFLSALPTLPPGSIPTADMLLSEILLSPSTSSHPYPLIYVTNRNEPLPAGDTIAVFAPHHASSLPPHEAADTAAAAAAALDSKSPGAEFQYLGSIATGLKHLRAIILGGPDSRYLVAGGAQGGGVKIFERNGASLREVASVEVEKPTSFIWL